MPGRNKDDTSVEISKILRNRMRVVAAIEGVKMKVWIERRVEEVEKK